jgi:hypothetical protein
VAEALARAARARCGCAELPRRAVATFSRPEDEVTFQPWAVADAPVLVDGKAGPWKPLGSVAVAPVERLPRHRGQRGDLAPRVTLGARPHGPPHGLVESQLGLVSRGDEGFELLKLIIRRLRGQSPADHRVDRLARLLGEQRGLAFHLETAVHAIDTTQFVSNSRQIWPTRPLTPLF